MTEACRCPACSSDKVYSLLDTLHCKRCKHIWKEEPHVGGSHGPAEPVIPRPLTIKHRAESIESQMEKRLNECLLRGGGRFRIDAIPVHAGTISLAVFRSYVKKCVACRDLAERTDRAGRTWYSRPD